MNRAQLVRRGLAVLAAGVALALVPATAPAEAATSFAFPRVVVSILRGANQVPAVQSNGIAIAVARIDPIRDKVCYFMAQANLVDVTLAHIHKGAKGVNGGVVVPLTAPVDGKSSGCVSVDDALAKDLAQNPQNYYFNIHTKANPGGEIRGQLHR
jgi:CHRD domain